MEKKPPGLMNSIQQLLNKLFFSICSKTKIFLRSGTIKPVEKAVPLSAQIPSLRERNNRYNRGYVANGRGSHQLSLSFNKQNIHQNHHQNHPRLQRGYARKAFVTPNLKQKFQAVCLLSILIIFNGCVADQNKTKKPTSTSENTQATKAKYAVPQFNADSAYNFIQKQVDFGPRVPNTPEHVACGNWLVNQFKRYGLKVTTQEAGLEAFDGTILKSKNIIAKYKPERRRRIMFSAHWDTRPFSDHDPDKSNYNKPILGANDGGSGVGVIIELARLVAKDDVPLGIDFVLFDSEDYGQPEDVEPMKPDTYCLGSQYWAKSVRGKPYLPMYGILLDMVGGPGAKFTKEGTSLKYAAHIVDKVWNKADELGYSGFFRNEKTKGVIDDHYYVNPITNIPTIDIIEYDPTANSNFNKHWHTQKDDMDNINRETLKAVGQTILAVYYAEAYE